MKKVRTQEIALKWGVSDRTIRNYCEKGLIDNAQKIGKIWYINSNTKKPEIKRHNKINILKELLKEKENKKKGSLYHYSQIVFAYNSNKIEGSRLSEEQTQEIYETNSYIPKQKEVVKLDDAIETKNHFRLFDYMLENVNKKITKKMLIDMNVILKRNTSDESNPIYNIGRFKIKENEIGSFANPISTSKPKNVEKDLDKLLVDYNSKTKINIEDIIDFHYKFEKIHPFADGKGRVGRMVMFKECLRNNLVPFIVSDDKRAFYMRGLKEYKKEKGYLIDTILYEQDIYEKVVNKYLKK